MPLGAAFSGIELLLQSRQIGTDPTGIGADVAFAHPRDRTHINAAACLGGTDPHNYVVFEAKPGGCVGGFDSQRMRFGRHDVSVEISWIY